jgi:hypothetical protein
LHLPLAKFLHSSPAHLALKSSGDSLGISFPLLAPLPNVVRAPCFFLKPLLPFHC